MLRKVGRFLFSPIRHWRISLTILIGLVIAYKVVDQVLLVKLAAQRESIMAAGGHLSLRDFDLKLPENENAAVAYEYAGSLIEDPEKTRFDWPDLFGRYEWSGACGCDDPAYPEAKPLTVEEEAVLAGLIEKYANVFSALEEGYRRRSCQFGRYDVPPEMEANATYMVLHKMAVVRNLVRFALLRSIWESRHGNLEGAYHWLAVGLHVTKGLDNDPLLIAGLTRTASQMMILSGLQVLLCENPLPDPLPAEFVAELTSAADRGRLERFYEGERCLTNGINLAYTGHLNRLLITANQMYALKGVTELIDIMNEPDDALHARRVAQFNEETPEQKSKYYYWFVRPHRIIADITRPALARSIVGLERGIAEARVAQVAVAVKQWKARHGEYPAALGEVGELPVDPLTAGPFEYQREGEGFVVRSARNYGRKTITWCIVR